MKNIYKMVKKGKFKLLSYIVDENLIYYKSLNKHKKLVAFLILEVEVLNSVLSILNDFLKKGFIKYYSIQINTYEIEKKEILINIEDDEKSKIVKIFNIIHNRAINCDLNARFLKNKHLETQFLRLFVINKNAEIKILKKSDLLEFYSIQLELLRDKRTFLHDFSKLVYNFKKNGFLILNFRMDYKEGVILNPYFVSIKKITEKTTDLGKEINNFFNLNILKKQSIKMKSVASLLWRVNIFNSSYLLTKFIDLFSPNSLFEFNNLSNFNSQFEQYLFQNNVSFKRLNPNLLFINQNSLFITIFKFDSQELLKLLKKFHLKYFIFLLILDENVYEEVLKIDKIDFLIFKQKKLLENPQVNSNILS